MSKSGSWINNHLFTYTPYKLLLTTATPESDSTYISNSLQRIICSGRKLVHFWTINKNSASAEVADRTRAV